MKLWTKELERKAAQFPLGSQDGKGLDAIVLVKYFNPYGAGTWLITEAEKQEEKEENKDTEKNKDTSKDKKEDKKEETEDGGEPEGSNA